MIFSEKKMKKLGIYGGSFSPPHNGHKKSALSFYDSCALDELRVMPAGVPPHKVLEGDATPEDRLNMTRILFSPDNCGGRNVSVDDYELKKEGRSYTWETLAHFDAEDVQLFLLVGTDMFLTLDSWMRPEEIFSRAVIVVNRREEDYEESLFDEKKAYYENAFGARIMIPAYKPLVVSSSELRAQLRRGDVVNGYLPMSRTLDRAVLDYIVSRDLYGYIEGVLSFLREDLKTKLSEARLAHVLSVERETVSMARLLGLPLRETFILRKAALLHDVTHERSPEEQRACFAQFGVKPDEEDFRSPAVVHQFTGALVAERVYHLEKEGVDAICCHTTGKPGMVLCLADYIEKTRPYPECKALRRYFYEKAQAGRVCEALLDDCMEKYLNTTVAHLRGKGSYIHPQTLAASEYYTK